MASDMRRKEREANDALQQQVSALKANAKQNAQAQKAEIKDKYAQQVAALEHKEAEELQELQQLLAQRVLEAKKLSDTEVGRFAVSDMASKVQHTAYHKYVSMTCHSLFMGKRQGIGCLRAFKQGVGVGAGDLESAKHVPICLSLIIQVDTFYIMSDHQTLMYDTLMSTSAT